MSDSIKKFVDYVAQSNPNEPEFMQAVHEVAETVIPFIKEELKPLCSISFNPAIVHPFGDVTLSISSSGCD